MDKLHLSSKWISILLIISLILILKISRICKSKSFFIFLNIININIANLKWSINNSLQEVCGATHHWILTNKGHGTKIYNKWVKTFMEFTIQLIQKILVPEYLIPVLIKQNRKFSIMFNSRIELLITMMSSMQAKNKNQKCKIR